MKTGLSTFVLVVALATAGKALVACSNATDGDTGYPTVDAASPGSDATAGGHDSASLPGADSSQPSTDSAQPSADSAQPSADGDGDGGGVDAPKPIINEVAGKGANWVELYNAGLAALDLSGFAVTDEHSDGGGPSLGKAVTFPSGTVLSPNSYLVVSEQAADASAGAAPICPDGGQSYCFGSTWGISNTSGENLYVLDPQENISSQVAYPANVLQDGQTWGRIPNGTGALQANLPTPGATNVAN